MSRLVLRKGSIGRGGAGRERIVDRGGGEGQYENPTLVTITYRYITFKAKLQNTKSIESIWYNTRQNYSL